MLTFIIVAGLCALVAIGYYAYRIRAQSAKEAPGSSKIANVGDLNKNNKLGKFGIDGL